MKLEDLTLDVEQHIEVKAAIGDVYKGMLRRLGEGNTRPDGVSLKLQIEEWPGGRWFRDLGNGVGHLWGHVQVLKPPTLIELSGPMFMSYPAMNHVEVRLAEVSGGTLVTLHHRAIGLISEDHAKGVSHGWQHMLDSVKGDFTK